MQNLYCSSCLSYEAVLNLNLFKMFGGKDSSAWKKRGPSFKVVPRVASGLVPVGGYERTGKSEGLNLPAMMLLGVRWREMMWVRVNLRNNVTGPVPF